MSKIIEVMVDAKGGIRIRTSGFAGSSCLEGSRFLEEALGKRTASKLTNEFYRSVDAKTGLHIAGDQYGQAGAQ